MSFEITVLGNNSALPTSNGFPSGHAVKLNNHLFLIDCGEGTQIQLRRKKFNFNKIESIFISHLHGDHYFGIFGLLSSMNLLGRTKQINIYADADLLNILNTVLDKEIFSFKINFNELNFSQSQTIFENRNILIKSFPLNHRINACGFYFSEKPKVPNIKKDKIKELNLPVSEIVKIKAGNDFVKPDGTVVPNSELIYNPAKPRSYAYCSDTAYFENIISAIQNVDLLYHEATFENEAAELAKKTGHSTAEQAATIAYKANAKKLIIGHFSPRYKKPDILEKQARQIFAETYIAETGKTFIID